MSTFMSGEFRGRPLEIFLQAFFQADQRLVAKRCLCCRYIRKAMPYIAFANWPVFYRERPWAELAQQFNQPVDRNRRATGDVKCSRNSPGQSGLIICLSHIP